MRERWDQSDNPGTVVRGATWRAAIWVVCAVVFVGLIGVGIWGFKVATSDVKGAGDAARTKNSGTNRIADALGVEVADIFSYPAREAS